jgi:histidyl-tRNA synthetase
MSLSTQPYKGARDFYPEDKRLQKFIFGKLRQVVESFGYQEYDAPLLEPFEIYAAKSGEEIVNEQLYSFEDKGGRRVAIRPEMTPSVSRLVAARRQEFAYPLRLYSLPNLWRYERPQRGRLREHWQLNVDLFGVDGLEADAEIIQVADAILKSFGAPAGSYRINVNSRQHMVLSMADFGVGEDELKAVYKIVDKMPKINDETFRQLLDDNLSAEKAEKLMRLIKSDEPPENIKRLLNILRKMGVDNVYYEASTVRGLGYYTDIVFEVFDTDPENPRAMFGGGRYDGLVGLFGVEPVPTVGFGMGDVTLQNFLQTHQLLPQLKPETDAVAILVGAVYEAAQEPLAELRAKGVNIAVDNTSRKLDAQIKSAVKSGARYALFIGEKELQSKSYKLRDLEKGEERQLSINQIASTLTVRRQNT